MQLIRSQRPELVAPSNRLLSWFREPMLAGPRWPALFDWDADFGELFSSRRLGADLYEDDDAYYVRVEMPGVKKGDLRVELENAVLTVSHEQSSGGDESEASTERFARSLSIPDDVVADRVTAKLEDGILTVTLPKEEAKKPRAIEVS